MIASSCPKLQSAAQLNSTPRHGCCALRNETAQLIWPLRPAVFKCRGTFIHMLDKVMSYHLMFHFATVKHHHFSKSPSRFPKWTGIGPTVFYWSFFGRLTKAPRLRRSVTVSERAGGRQLARISRSHELTQSGTDRNSAGQRHWLTDRQTDGSDVSPHRSLGRDLITPEKTLQAVTAFCHN